MLLLLFALQGSTLLHPGPWDVIETGHIYSWTVAGIMDWNSLPVTDGTPITSMGFQPLPAWGSFRAACWPMAW